jgi:orotidine-5'-phosphate decarboxylase
VGAADFQFTQLKGSTVRLFEYVMAKSEIWGNEDQIMFVVGATKAEYLKDVRKVAKKHFLLIPGVGAQGGSLEEVSKHGMNKECGLLVNSARGIIYASDGCDYPIQAAKKAMEIQDEMKRCLDLYM